MQARKDGDKFFRDTVEVCQKCGTLNAYCVNSEPVTCSLCEEHDRIWDAIQTLFTRLDDFTGWQPKVRRDNSGEEK